MRWVGWLLMVGLVPWTHSAPLKLAASMENIAIGQPFLHEWFGLSGIEFQLIPCSYARCEKLIDTVNAVDGDMARIKGFELTHPHMLPVGSPLAHATVYVRSQPTAHWPPISQQRIGCQRGVQWCSRHLPHHAIVWFNDEKQGIALLKRGRIDWVVKMLPAYQSPLPEPWQPIAEIEVYLYLNKQHHTFITILVNSQQQLIASGRWQQMQLEYLSALLKPAH